MLTFLLGIATLVLGYVFYGKFIERNFGIEHKRRTPAFELADGNDFVVLGTRKNALIQLLNIAGTGPIFGPIMGALYGPVAFIWIIFGNIFAGAVHDFMLGMISLRNEGAHLPELAGRYLGKAMKHVVNAFAALLLLLVGTVFVTSPANLLANLTPGWLGAGVLTLLIFGYYILSTLLPIDKLIGKIYPFFGALLIISTFAIFISLIVRGEAIPNLTLDNVRNMHPAGVSLFPGILFTISCGAMSGFHATQTPIISRTLDSESDARFVFYGMMTTEGVVAMIWAAAAMALYDAPALSGVIAEGTASLAVEQIARHYLGAIGGTFAILGVIILPITSGDTAFRSLRMIIADYLNIAQKAVSKRLLITIPIFMISIALTFMDFNILWRYFNWANQSTAAIALLVSTRYLYLKDKNYLVTLAPASFMLYAVVVYILNEQIGFGLNYNLSLAVGLAITTVLLLVFWQSGLKQKNQLHARHVLLNDHLPIKELRAIRQQSR
ncbi:Carbon starvation protein A [Alkalibacterium sp. AK22]|uniref:carbon starvation CstA family protein n=1 Tax=Alkalibacterium sp. AK22 TaxID=1229520 RepID=UPI0004476DDD|nr:carbon starvation CstA family protein [Alkalibacterium sp. AK22]EXJ24301.1 Carbon starvation protein A [Alkalibacterium sp. AK22]